MENAYTVYTKVINEDTFYFVKKYTVFPEYGTVPGVLESMGMHRDFYRACDIANVHDEVVINDLFAQLPPAPDAAKRIPMLGVKGFTHAVIKNTQHALSKLRLAGIHIAAH